MVVVVVVVVVVVGEMGKGKSPVDTRPSAAFQILCKLLTNVCYEKCVCMWRGGS